MRLTRTSAPAVMPVSEAEARAHCRVNSDEDAEGMIAALVQAATDYLDGPTGILGRAIVSQVWRLELPAWPGGMVLPIEPVLSVAVSYVDAAGDVQQLDDSASYLVQNPGAAAQLAWASGFVSPVLSADAPFPVRIDMTCGFGDAEDVPQAIKTAIKMMVAHWYDHRAAVASAPAEVPMAVSALLARYRRLV